MGTNGKSFSETEALCHHDDYRFRGMQLCHEVLDKSVNYFTVFLILLSGY